MLGHRKLLSDKHFEVIASTKELSVWTFLSVVKGFPGKQQEGHYQLLVNNFLQNYKDLGFRMSLKIYFLHAHLNLFPQYLGEVGDEEGERFH